MSEENQLAAAPTKSLKQMLSGDVMREQFKLCMPKHLDGERFCRIAITALSKTPKLQQCSPESFFKCLLDLSALGIEPDGRRAHLIPFDNKRLGITECTLILDYKGIVELVLRSGKIASIHADVVCQNDRFEFDGDQIEAHTYTLGEDRGDVIGAYATATYKDGGHKQSVILSKQEIDAVRGRSKSGNNGPWVTDYNEMAKKTAFRRLSKWLPLSVEALDVIAKSDAYEFEKVAKGREVQAARAVPIDPFSLPEATTEEGGAE